MDTVSCAPDVLIVDDDPTAVAYVHATLADAGYAVATASTGTAALSTVESLCPRLVILDVGMPDLDGLSICRQLRGRPATASLPVVFLSSSAAAEARIAGLRAGGVDFLGKPCERAELLARVEAHLEIVRLREALTNRNAELVQANDLLHAGIQAACRVQEAMLPHTEIADSRARFAWRCIQCERIGGDAVSILPLLDGTYLVYILDASGHGVPASLLAVATGYFVTALAGNLLSHGGTPGPLSPAAILDNVNRVLAATAPPGAFVTMLVGIADVGRKEFTFASAGHPGPLLIGPDRIPAHLDQPGPPVGICDWAYVNDTVQIRGNDRLVLYSDGAFEQRNPAGEQFGRSRLAQAITGQADSSADDALANLVQSLNHWRGTRPMEDDVALLAIDFVGDLRGRGRGSERAGQRL